MKHKFLIKYNKVDLHMELYINDLIYYKFNVEQIDKVFDIINNFDYKIIENTLIFQLINSNTCLLVEKLYDINLKIYSVEFKNKNEYDLRYKNILIKYIPIPIKNITIINKPIIIGNNIYYEVQDNINNDIYWIINIETKYILIDTDIYNLLKSTYKNQIWKIINNIVSTKQLCSLHYKLVYKEFNMHVLIFSFYSKLIYNNNINITKFNNSLDSNIINYRQNNINHFIKKNRKNNAKILPIELANIQLPKYIVYYNEINKINNNCKQYFKIENHPKLLKPWISTTKKNIPIIDKYNQTIQKLQNLINF